MIWMEIRTSDKVSVRVHSAPWRAKIWASLEFKLTATSGDVEEMLC